MSPDATAEEIAGLRRELKLTWDAHAREHTQHEGAHDREHAFAQKAIDTAAEMAKENKADANEWRATMNDKDARLATKEDLKAILARLDGIERANIVRDERERIEKEEASQRISRSQWTIGIAIGVMAVMVNLVIRLVAS